MTTTDIIYHMADKHGLTLVQSRAIVMDILKDIRRSLLLDDKVVLKNLCTFSVREHAPKRGVGLDGKEVTHPAYKYLHVKMSKNFKEKLNEDNNV